MEGVLERNALPVHGSRLAHLVAQHTKCMCVPESSLIAMAVVMGMHLIFGPPLGCITYGRIALGTIARRFFLNSCNQESIWKCQTSGSA